MSWRSSGEPPFHQPRRSPAHDRSAVRPDPGERGELLVLDAHLWPGAQLLGHVVCKWRRDGYKNAWEELRRQVETSTGLDIGSSPSGNREQQPAPTPASPDPEAANPRAFIARLEALEKDLPGLSNAYEALGAHVAALDPDAVVLAQLDARTVLAGATEQHIRQLEGHRDKALGVLSDEGARIVAAAKEAAGDAPGALAALRAELARAIRL